MNKNIVLGFIFAIIFVMFLVFIVLESYADGYSRGYKEGQIDALSKNNIIYCLKDDELNQSTWKLCDEK